MTSPTVVYVNVIRDIEGKPRGFEKSPGTFHLTKDDAEAEAAVSALGGRIIHETVECMLVTMQWYDDTEAELESKQ